MRTKALKILNYVLLVVLLVLCSSCSGLLIEACVKDPPKNTLLDGSPRSNMVRWLGKPCETIVFPPSTVPIHSDELPPPAQTNEVRRMDRYVVSGRVDIPGVNAPDVGNLYPLGIIMTLGVSEVFYCPYTILNLTVRSMQRHQFRVWYDEADRLVDTKTGSIERHPVGLASARGLHEVEARPVAQAGNLRVEVKSAATASNCVVYWMGHPHYAPPFYLPEMDRRKKEVQFTLGNASSHVLKAERNFMLLILQCLVTNRGVGTADFRPMELHVPGFTNAVPIWATNRYFLHDYLVDNHLRLMGSTNAVAIGTGNIPFMKDHLVWKQMRKHEPEKIPAGGRKVYSYVFAVNRDQSRWDLHYDGKRVSELEVRD